MKIIKKKERGDRFYSEKYDLNGSYAGLRGVPIGVLLLYIIIGNAELEFVDLFAEADGEIGAERNILTVNDKEFFGDLKALADVFTTREFVRWELTLKYKDANLNVIGRIYNTFLIIFSPLDSDVNILPLMSATELCTYNYHSYSPELIDKMKKMFNMNQKVTILTLLDLEKQQDIYEEFLTGMNTDPFVFESNTPILVEGYTAKMLHDKFPLSELGAYNYLIYLRNNPAEALQDLKRGLPRK